jgi:outer membrane lipoprotein-sorting protein
MKQLGFVLAGLFIASAINAQSLDEILKKYTEANKYDKISSLSTIKISAKMSAMGNEFTTEIWMKNPDKIKTATNINGQDMVSALNGTKGYAMSPMSGSAGPVEMTSDEVKLAGLSNVFQNFLVNYYKEGKITFEGDENVNDKPAFKLKVDLDGGNSIMVFINKSDYLVVKNVLTGKQGGMDFTLESYPSDYRETNGFIMPMKTKTSVQGMEYSTTIDKVEVNVPMDDSIFSIK